MPEPKQFSPEHAGAPQDERDRIRAILEVERAHELTFLRDFARRLYDRRVRFQSDAYVTADDVAARYDEGLATGLFDRGAKRAFLGQVFKAPGWVKLDMMVKSRQARNHARLLHCWQWKP